MGRTKRELTQEIDMLRNELSDTNVQLVALGTNFSHHLYLHESLRANAFQEAHLRANAKPKHDAQIFIPVR